MKKWSLRKFVTAVAFVSMLGASALVFQACSKDSTNAGTNVSYVGSASPGDVWNFTLNRIAGTFTATSDAGQPSVASAAFTLSGTLEVLTSGFLKLTVTTKSANAPSSIILDGTNNVGYGIEVPTVAFILQPAGGGPTITSAYNGGCNALSGAGFNYIRAGFGSKTYNINTTDAYGSATFNGNSAAPQITGGNSKNISGGALTFTPPGTGTCTGGIITFPGGLTGIATMASGGIMILDQGASNGGIVVFGGNSLGASDLASKTFNGLVFKNNSSGTTAVKVTFDASSVGTVAPYTSVVNSTFGTNTNVIKSITGSGAIAGTVYAADGTSQASAFHGIMQAVSDDVGNGYKIMFGVSQDAGGSAPANFLLVQKQ